jgi:protein phosphatase
LRKGALTQISHDHTEVQDLLDRGILEAGEARNWPRRNVVTRALGVAGQPALEIADGAIAAGDRFLLCSDGLTNHVEDREIAATLGEGDPQKACDRLVALTLERGASDNITIVIVDCAYDTRTVRADPSWRAGPKSPAIPDRGIS